MKEYGVKVPLSKEQLHKQRVEFKFPHRGIEGTGTFEVSGPGADNLLHITIQGNGSTGFICAIYQKEADCIRRNPPDAQFSFACFVSPAPGCC